MNVILVTGGKGNLGKYIIQNFSREKNLIINLSEKHQELKK